MASVPPSVKAMRLQYERQREGERLKQEEAAQTTRTLRERELRKAAFGMANPQHARTNDQALRIQGLHSPPSHKAVSPPTSPRASPTPNRTTTTPASQQGTTKAMATSGMLPSQQLRAQKLLLQHQLQEQSQVQPVIQPEKIVPPEPVTSEKTVTSVHQSSHHKEIQKHKRDKRKSERKSSRSSPNPSPKRRSHGHSVTQGK